MSVAAARRTRGEAKARSTLRARLEARIGEIEQETAARVRAIADPRETADPAYAEGLRTAVMAAIEYGLAAVEHGAEAELPVPVALLAQARLAARNGISLDTVLRRYLAGYSLLGYFLIEEGGREGLMGGAELQRLLGSQAALLDRLLAAIGEEHARESGMRLLSAKQRRAERIERLLAGDLVDTTPIAYDFGGWHIGVIGCSERATATLRDLARELDLRLLLVERQDGETVWAWLGCRRRRDSCAVLRDGGWPPGSPLAVGEPGEGLAGWRTTHRQAAAAFPVARRGGKGSVRYADVALVAAVLRDDLLAESLRRLYIEPLKAAAEGGDALLDTLRAYLAVGGHLSSAAATLGVTARTVRNRLGRVEEALGRPLHCVLADLQTALRLQELQMQNGGFRIRPVEWS